jgi:hypothetical protein
MCANQAVSILLQHAPEMLTVRELLRVSASLKEWYDLLTTQLVQYYTASQSAYRFVKAIARSPSGTYSPPYGGHPPDATFASDTWAPFTSLFCHALTPTQWAYYYAYWFYVARDTLCPSWLLFPQGEGKVFTEHVTFLLHPSGLIRHMTTKPVPLVPPYIKLENTYDTLSAVCNFQTCDSGAGNVDLFLLGVAAHFPNVVFTELQGQSEDEEQVNRLTHGFMWWDVRQVRKAVKYVITPEGTKRASVHHPLLHFFG